MEQGNRLNELFKTQRLTVINIGVKAFADAVAKQPDTEVIQVNWRPLASGDKEMQDMLAVLGF